MGRLRRIFPYILAVNILRSGDQKRRDTITANGVEGGEGPLSSDRLSSSSSSLHQSMWHEEKRRRRRRRKWADTHNASPPSLLFSSIHIAAAPLLLPRVRHSPSGDGSRCGLRVQRHRVWRIRDPRMIGREARRKYNGCEERERKR